jgi:hypothetical protein
MWFLVLGGVGFLAGFIGPVVFNPEANQGPLFGIFISGPGGAVLGLILGGICLALKVPARNQWGILALSAVVLALATLTFCLPEPELRGYALEVQVDRCQPPAQVVDNAITYWDGRIAKATWATPREEWQEDARARAQTADGVVLDVSILREARIVRNRKPWNNGQLSTHGWHTEANTKSYYADFAGNSCADYPMGKKTVFYSPYEVTGMSRGKGDWPPRNLADFLDRAVLQKMPDEYRDIVPQ